MQDIAEAPAGETHVFPCSACGSDLEYVPGERNLRCTHCGAEEPLELAGPWTRALAELDYQSALASALPDAAMEETRVLHCDSCGADVQFDEDQHAGECPFCASPIVTGTGIHRHIKPAGVLPFALTEREARGAMKRWLGRLWFAPNALRKYAVQGRPMQGIYVPYWTFDAMTRTRYAGRRGTEHRSTVGRGKNRRTTTRVRWANVSGNVKRHFDDILILASNSLPQRHTDALAPWDMGALEPYHPQFLAGFRAEGYNVDLPDGFVQARAVMDAVIERDIRFDIGGDRQQISRKDTALSDVTFKHVLLPVWLAAYRYNGKVYRFVVNGRTGRVEGERPWSAWKIAIAVVLGAIVAGAIGYLIALSEGAV